MKNDDFVKIFCTLLTAAVSSFAVTSFGYDEASDPATLDRNVEPADAVLPDRVHPFVTVADTAVPAPEITSDRVYITATGTKYHLAGCSYLRSGASEIALGDAEEQGYTPCSRCFK